MSRVTPYVKTDWEDIPSTSSPINSIHLNHLETGVKNVTDAVNEIVVEVEPATPSKLGGIKVGSGLSVTQDGTLSANAQTLEPATASKLGGIKVGSNLSITQDGTLSADAQQYTLPPATQSTLGGIKVGSRLSVTQDGTLSADAQTYTLPPATQNTLGGIKVGSGLSVTQDGTLSANGGGGGASELNDLDDVAVSNPSSGQVLKYNATTSKFENSAEGGSYVLPPATQNTLGGIMVGNGLNVNNNGLLNNAHRRLDSLTDTDIDAEDGQILRYIYDEEEENGVWKSVRFPIASASNLGGIKVGENLSITQDGTLSATGGGSAESMTYEETISVLDELSYTKVKLFQTARTISESGPWRPSPQTLTISEDGLITFSPTGISDVSGIYLGTVIDLEGFTIPIGSKLVFSGKGGEDLYFTYQLNKVELVDGKTTIAMDCSSGRLALYIVVTNGKTYDISCVPEVWIPQT